MLFIFIMLSCGVPQVAVPDVGPPQSEGTVLWKGADSLLVYHPGTQDRTVPGIEHYPTAADVSAAEVGSHVALWVDRDGSGWGTIQRLEVTGVDPLSDDFDP